MRAFEGEGEVRPCEISRDAPSSFLARTLRVACQAKIIQLQALYCSDYQPFVFDQLQVLCKVLHYSFVIEILYVTQEVGHYHIHTL